MDSNQRPKQTNTFVFKLCTQLKTATKSVSWPLICRKLTKQLLKIANYLLASNYVYKKKNM